MCTQWCRSTLYQKHYLFTKRTLYSLFLSDICIQVNIMIKMRVSCYIHIKLLSFLSHTLARAVTILFLCCRSCHAFWLSVIVSITTFFISPMKTPCWTSHSILPAPWSSCVVSCKQPGVSGPLAPGGGIQKALVLLPSRCQLATSSNTFHARGCSQACAARDNCRLHAIFRRRLPQPPSPLFSSTGATIVGCHWLPQILLKAKNAGQTH